MFFYEDTYENMQVRIYHRKLPLKKLRLTNEIFLDDFVMAEFTEWNSSFGHAQSLELAKYGNFSSDTKELDHPKIF